MELDKSNGGSEKSVQWRNNLEKRRQFFLKAEKSFAREDFGQLNFEATGELSKVRSHPADLATDNQQIEVLESLSERSLKGIQDVEDAIDRLNKGDYGKCLSCGELIAEKRLEVQPEAKFCIECEQDAEELPKHFNLKRRSEHSEQSQERMKAFEVVQNIAVSEIMQRDPIALTMGDTLEQAAALMLDNNIRHLPVVDPNGDIQGIISDRDVLNTMLKSQPWRLIEKLENPWRKILVSSLMTRNPEVVSPDTKLFDASLVITENKFSCLPVVDGNRLVGIVTETDFVKLFRSE